MIGEFCSQVMNDCALQVFISGYTLGIPDSAMGITFLAAGGSVPEAVAVIVVARAGKIISTRVLWKIKKCIFSQVRDQWA